MKKVNIPGLKGPHFILVCLLWMIFPLPLLAIPAAKFTYDPAFRLKNKPFAFKGVANEDQLITKMISSGDGGVLIVGSFTGFNRKIQQRILKLDSTLAQVSSFAPAVDGVIADVALAPEGKIFIGGDFTSVDGLSRNGFARLLSTGSVDPDFNPLDGANGASSNVMRVLPFADGALGLFGTFSKVQGIRTDFSIAKVSASGLVDFGFAVNLANVGLSDGTRSISLTDSCEMTPEGRILVLGFGSDSSKPGESFEGSTVIESDGTRTESIHDASLLLESRQHARGTYADGSGSASFISHEKFNAQFKPITETLYRFGSNGSLDANFRIQNKIYFNSAAIKSDGTFLVSPQTVSIKTSSSGKTSYSAKPLIQHYSREGSLTENLILPALKGKAFEYRNILPLGDGSLLAHVRIVMLSKRAGTGRTFKHFLIKVKARS